MEKVGLSTANIAAENAAKLAELFPDVLTEVMDEDGNVHYGIDAEALRAHVGDIAEDKRERYQFTWPGKQRARAEAIRPIDKTMRPALKESVNWDTTENLYIEGDNLDALKILRETYAGKIKMIYIDPPYNTGHDFVYNDSFACSAEEERAESGAFDEEGNVLDKAYKQNNESNGRFHSDWCSMMYPRLVLARDLLSEDGVIFISIDSHEIKNAREICDGVFGASALKNCIAVRRGIKNVQAQFDDLSALSQGHEYLLLYAKNSTLRMSKLQLRHDGKPGKWDTFWRGTDRPTMRYELFGETPSAGQWRWEKGRTLQAVSNYELYLSKGSGLSIDEYYLDHLAATNEKLNFVRKNEAGTVQYYVPPSRGKLLSDNWMDLTLSGSETDAFDTEKSVQLMMRSVGWVAGEGDIVLDFFSGSATTAHAVMQLNAEDGGNRKFIMVQLPEVCDEKSEAAKAGYKNICEIGKERIRRAGTKIAAEVEQANAQLKLGEEPRKVPDIGFRVLKIDSSNFKDVKSTPDAIRQDQLFGMADNLKPDRTPEDILFQLFPQFEIPFTARIEKLSIGGKTVYSVDDDTLLACFDAEVSEDVIRAMATRQPLRAVLRDASFIGDDALTNFEEIFKTLSPSTETRVV